MRSTLFALLLLSSLGAKADRIDLTTAKDIAKSFLNSSPNSQRRVGAAIEFSVAEETENYYALNRPDEGFVIVASDDAIPNPIIGYSDNGSIDAGNMSPALRAWLNGISEQIEYVRKNPSSTAKRVRKAPVERQEITPMLKSTWGQGYPYNMECIGEINYYATGCVATAMAQIMYYHKWPNKGNGSHSYIMGEEENSVLIERDYSQSEYDWNIMANDYIHNRSDESKNAVARLMADAGTSVSMEYGYNESGAYSGCVPAALFKYFSYSGDAKLYTKDSMTVEQWEDSIYTSLQKYGPVFYCGKSATVNHAFVCDGYQNGYYHFNFGWKGSGDGYYLLDATGVNSYSNNQEAIINIHPVNEKESHKVEMYGYIYRWMADIVNDTISLKYYKVASYYDDLLFGLKIICPDGNAIIVPEIGGVKNYACDKKDYYLNFHVNNIFTKDGKYEVRSVVKTEGGEWEDMNNDSSSGTNLIGEVVVSDGKIYNMNSYDMFAHLEYVSEEDDYTNSIFTKSLKIKNNGLDTLPPTDIVVSLFNSMGVNYGKRFIMRGEAIEPGCVGTYSGSVEVECPGDYYIGFIWCESNGALHSIKGSEINPKTIDLHLKEEAPIKVINNSIVTYEDDHLYFDYKLKYSKSMPDTLVMYVMSPIVNSDDIEKVDARDKQIVLVEHISKEADTCTVRFPVDLDLFDDEQVKVLYLKHQENGVLKPLDNSAVQFSSDESFGTSHLSSYTVNTKASQFKLVVKNKDGNETSFLLADKPQVMPNVEDGSVTVSAGEAVMTLKLAAIDKIRVEKVVDEATAIEDIMNETNSLAVQIADGNIVKVYGTAVVKDLRVFDISGRMVKPSYSAMSDNSIVVDMGTLPHGTYVVKINNQSFKINTK